MTANRNSGRTLSGQQTNSFADALSNGIRAASRRDSPSSAQIAEDTAHPEDDASDSMPAYQVLKLTPNATAAARNITPEMLARVALNRQHAEARARAHIPPRQRRRLLAAGVDRQQSGAAGADAAPQGLTPLEAFEILESGMYNLTAVQSITLGGAAQAAGNAAVCVAPALLPQRAVDNFNITFDCPGITVPAQVRQTSSWICFRWTASASP